jgi:hypothetical protein
MFTGKCQCQALALRYFWIARLKVFAASEHEHDFVGGHHLPDLLSTLGLYPTC